MRPRHRVLLSDVRLRSARRRAGAAAVAQAPDGEADPPPGRREHGLRQQDHDERDDHPRPARLAHGQVQVLDPGPDQVLHRVPRPAAGEGHQDAQARGPALDLHAGVGPDDPHLRAHAPPVGHGLGPLLRGHDGGPAAGRALRGRGRRRGARSSDRPCWVLDLVSRGEEIAYFKRKIWVDKERYVVLREERFAKSGKLLKTTEVQSVERVRAVAGSRTRSSSRTPSRRARAPSSSSRRSSSTPRFPITSSPRPHCAENALSKGSGFISQDYRYGIRICNWAK